MVRISKTALKKAKYGIGIVFGLLLLLLPSFMVKQIFPSFDKGGIAEADVVGGGRGGGGEGSFGGSEGTGPGAGSGEAGAGEGTGAAGSAGGDGGGDGSSCCGT